MTPNEIGPEWAAQDFELLAAEREAKTNLLMGALPPLLLGLIGWAGIRKQRRAHRAAWQAIVEKADAADAHPCPATFDTMPMAAAWCRLEAFLPDWAALTEIGGTWVVVDRATNRLVTTVIGPEAALERTDEQLAEWAARLQPAHDDD